MSELYKDKRIQTPELAHLIGYAEYPHIEMARTALRVGLDNDYQQHINDADEAGKEVAVAYAQSVIDDLSKYVNLDLSLDLPDPETQFVHENYPGVTVTKADLIAFAELCNVAGMSSDKNSQGKIIHPNANYASQVWSSLSMFINEMKKDEGSFRLRRHKPIMSIDLDFQTTETRSETKLLSITMDSLENFLAEFDRISDEINGATSSEILGARFSEKKVTFLRDYFEFRQCQLDQNTDDSIKFDR